MSVSESNNNIRIRTTPLGSDKYVKINLNQNFDFLEILSLKISQEEVYKKYCSDYGVIAGRVVCNDGVGVPNAKIAVFIPISEDDKERPEIRSRYPYEFTSDIDVNNIKYNLLSEKPRMDDLCHRSVGTFPEKRRIIDCDPWCEIYGKYYKYSTSTNEAGDYMIFGVPTGVQKIHMDVDLSDIGYLSQKPYEMVAQGSPTTMFDSLNQFKVSNNLTQLPQIKTQEKTINVLPFWGNLDQCEVGINRVDFNLEYKIITSAFFIGSIFTDSLKNSVSKRCRPRPDLGLNRQLVTREGTISSIRKTPYGGLEVFDINGGRVIDEDGVWIVQVPMNLETKITDEFGNLIDSGNPEIGIATKAKYRFKISFNENPRASRIRTTAKFLVPNYGDYTFGDDTNDTVSYNGTVYPNFAEMQWNGVYTVKQFIGRFSKRKGLGPKSYVGIKDVGSSDDVNPFPYNNVSQDVSFLFSFLCILMNIILLLMSTINILITLWNEFLTFLANICLPPPLPDWCPFEFVLILEAPCVSVPIEDVRYCPFCDNNRDDRPWCQSDADIFFERITNLLAQAFDVFKFNFMEDWINGTLYAFQYKLKEKIKVSKFCDVNDDRFGINYISSFNCGTNDYVECTIASQKHGIIHYNQNENEYFYAAKNKNNVWLYPTDIYNLGSMKVCDPLGNPQINNEIPASSFNLPDEDFGVIECDENGNNCFYSMGTDPFLITVNCVDVKSNEDQCVNQRRFCEIGVDYNDDIGRHDVLVDDDILEFTEPPRTGAALLRSQLECLNAPSLCLDCESLPDGLFTVDWRMYRTANLFSDTVLGYDEKNICSFYRKNEIKNSFYFYFGVIPGKTAIDKLISQYFAPCERTENCPIFISGSVENNKCVSGSTGSITVSPKYGTPPYRYDWYLGVFILGGNNTPLVINGGDTITNLPSDTYTVVVTDSQNNICKKTFAVIDPSPFTVFYEYSPFICPGTNNGFIDVTVAGGTPPYFISWNGGADVTAFNTANTINSFYLTNLGPTALCSSPNNGGGSTNTAVYDFVYPINDITLYADAYNTPVSALTTFGNAIIPNPAVSTQFFTAPSNGNYTFEYNFRIDATYGPCGVSNFTVGFLKNLTTFTTIVPNSTIQSGSLWNYYYNGSTTISLNSGDTLTLRLRCSANNNGCNLDEEGSITVRLRDTILSLVRNNSGGSSGGGGGGTTNLPYFAQVYDSSGQYGCLNYSGLSIDIVQSCGFSLTSTTTHDYCSGSTRGSFTWGPVGGGVPPFTYILENSTNFYWSGTSTEYEKIRKYLTGTTCPGLTYTATCIDSCGSSAVTTNNIVRSYLRFVRNLVVRGEQGGNNAYYRWYADFFVGTSDSSGFIYTNTCPSNPYYGSWAGGDGTINPTTFWYEIPPLEPSIPVKFNVFSDNGNRNGQQGTGDYYWTVRRSSLNSSQDVIEFINFWDTSNGGGLDTNCRNINSITICKTETFSMHCVYVQEGAVTSSCRYSIKTNGCSDPKIQRTITLCN